MKPRLLSCAGVCSLALLFGAAGADAAELALPSGMRVNAMPVKSMKDLRFQATLRQQYDFSCGSAALATLLTHHYNIPTTEQMAFQEMFSTGDQQKIRSEGFSLLDMQRFLKKRGYTANGFQLPLDKLIEAKLPAIVLISDNGYHHFVVVKGAEDGRILIGDPSRGTRLMARERFESIWANRILFVIHEGPNKPGFNLAADWRNAPRAPLVEGARGALENTYGLPKFGPGDF
ncbi:MULTISPECIES: C39 family peptidase [unclassified Massilia]|uniref:C39 family peptidase n=1 Tax=unclassified Massilia TaxID=2609279 RepID=UPI001784B6BC|nr:MULTISPECIES: C39 family peptidase [unclassified Massilia]MBD8530046.1 C39 family peptidase [Massilia sp. CFBP 13647]MBD8674125.1 C39 family peptidase [Massilia sp. CFBP 13721]